MRIPAAFARVACVFCLSGISIPCPAQAQQQGSQSSAPAAGASTAANPSTIDPQLKANILKLLDLTHAMSLGHDAAVRMLQSLRPALIAALPPTEHREQIADAYGDKLTSLLTGQEMSDQLTGIYARHLSADDVSAMIQFYQTPAGQHSLAALPQIMAESQQLGANVAQENLPRILRELCTEFPELRGKVKFCPAGTGNESGEKTGGVNRESNSSESFSAPALPHFVVVSSSEVHDLEQQAAPPRVPGTSITNSKDSPLDVPWNVMIGRVVRQVNPGFPAIAAAAHVSGTVVLEVLVGKDGKVENAKVLSGPELLRDWATDAVKQWVFKPAKVKGKPVEVRTKISMVFTAGD